MKDLKHKGMNLSAIAGGSFIHCFRSETYFPDTHYSLRDFLKYEISTLSKKLIEQHINYKKKQDQELIYLFLLGKAL